MPQPGIEKLAIDTIRTLSIDAVQKANSGHPGAPMALAPVAYALWQNVLRYDPAEPTWPNRDRFVLSNGHASMLLYSVLHLTGVRQVDHEGRVLDAPAVSLDDIKSFRQLDSRTPGHPEYRITSGVGVDHRTARPGCGELGGDGHRLPLARAPTTTGPNFTLFDFDVYAILGDGCMMEGISSEAASLAGHLKLPNLCWFYDNNHISLDGRLSLSFSEDVPRRFEAYGWATTHVTDANDLGQLSKALQFFKQQGRPTLIVVDSHIGYGSPKRQDTSAAHGEPLGDDQVRAAKKFYGWPEDAQFLVPDGVREHFEQGIGTRARKLRQRLGDDPGALRQGVPPELSRELEPIDRFELPPGWDAELPVFPADPKGMATRESSGQVLNALAKRIPWLLGGAADLSGSTKVTIKGEPNLAADEPGGRNIYYGVREHAMGAIVNGMVLSQAARLREHLPHLHRLHARADPALVADGDPGVPRDDPRLHRARRGRADSPADRAARLAARRCPGSG